jgi:hypothetical protein
VRFWGWGEGQHDGAYCVHGSARLWPDLGGKFGRDAVPAIDERIRQPQSEDWEHDDGSSPAVIAGAVTGSASSSSTSGRGRGGGGGVILPW